MTDLENDLPGDVSEIHVSQGMLDVGLEIIDEDFFGRDPDDEGNYGLPYLCESVLREAYLAMERQRRAEMSDQGTTSESR